MKPPLTLRLPVMPSSDPRAATYQSLSTDVNPRTEREILLSMDSALAACGACWLVGATGMYQAARRKAELKQIHLTSNY